MATAQDVVNEASVLLGDKDQTRWDFDVLIPLIQKAHRELQVDLNLAGLPVLKKTSAVITIPALTLDLTAPAGGGASLQPTDLIEPVDMKERQFGVPTDLFSNMIQTTWEPDATQSTTLRYWSWKEEKIIFLGATVAVDVKLHYIKGLAAPTSEGSDLGFINALLFLGPRTAALAAAVAGNLSVAQALNADAEIQKAKVIRYNVKQMQAVPKRRIPYRRGRVSIGRII